MAKNDSVETPVVEREAGLPDSYELTLDEFCVRLSQEVRAPELIGGFHHAELAAGHVKGSDSDYRVRYQLFCTKPA